MKKRIIAIITVLALLMCFVPHIDSEAMGGLHIYVNTQTNVVTVYQNGKPIKAFVCSTGLPETATPHGTFHINGKARWGNLLGSAGQYTARIVGQVLFHSVPCERYGDAGSVMTDCYDNLGKNASHGCVRLNVEAARWIWDNVPNGTPVTVMASGSNGPLGKPNSPKLKRAPSIFRRWDPTDRWSAGNPWYTNYEYLGSQVFDPVYYRNKYADLRNYGEAALRYHWVAYGIKEGRQASKEFNINYYKSANADVRAQYGNNNYGYVSHYSNYGKKQGRQGCLPEFGNALSTKFYSAKYSDLNSAFGTNAEKLTNHYRNCGLNEGRQGSPVFNINTYKNLNQDVAKAFGNDNMKIVQHFNQYGMKEGRRASTNFDVMSYKNQYQDLRLAFGNDLAKYYEHYNNYGYYEGRKATGVSTVQNAVTQMNGMDYRLVYDYNYYVSHNPDVKSAFGNDDIAVLRHFVNYGMKEGRQGKASFSVSSYKNQYPDLRNEFGNDLKSYYIHYIKYGYREGRKSTGCSKPVGGITKLNGVDYSAVYNYNYYISHNQDVKNAIGTDDVKVLQHFVKYGMKEGRQGSSEFSLTKYKSRYGDLVSAFGSDNTKYYLHYMNYGKKEGRSAK